MKRLLLCIVALVFVLAACGNNSSNNKDNQSSSKDKDTLRVGTEGTYAPFTYHNKKDQLTGYDIDVIKAVAKEENLKLKFNETSWDSMFAGLDAGRFDVIANQVGVNKDREKKYKFSEPYTYSSAVLVVRENEKLLETDKKIVELMKRYEDIDMEDTQTWSNQAVFFTRQLWNMLVLARVITIGAYNRNESRGAHYKPEFPERNDEEWLKTTMASFQGAFEKPQFTYDDVDVSLIPPRKRDYTSKSKGGKK